MDVEVCYPSVADIPYWITFVGFITSIIVTTIAYSSGHGIFYYIKSCIKCKCCKKIDMNETNGWEEYPKIITITNPWACKPQRHLKDIYGDYTIKPDRYQTIPYYESVAATSSNVKRYCLRYISYTHPVYEGWILVVEDEKNFKYHMMQVDDDMSHNSLK